MTGRSEWFDFWTNTPRLVRAARRAARLGVAERRINETLNQWLGRHQ